MSDLVAFAATVHFPYVTAWPERAPADLRSQTMIGFRDLGNAIRDAAVETLVVFTSEHIVNLSPRLAPPFIIGTAAEHPTFPEPHFNLPLGPRGGDAALANELVGALYAAGFDPAHSSELRLDHGTTLPLALMNVAPDVAIVPIVINSLFAPLPTLARTRAFGSAVARAIAVAPQRRRVGMLATGGLSHTVGAPDVARNDPAFDQRVIDALVAGRLDDLCALDDATLDAAGNGTHEIRNWIALAAAAADWRPQIVNGIPFVSGWDTGVHQLVWRAA